MGKAGMTTGDTGRTPVFLSPYYMAGFHSKTTWLYHPLLSGPDAPASTSALFMRAMAVWEVAIHIGASSRAIHKAGTLNSKADGLSRGYQTIHEYLGGFLKDGDFPE